jgi:flagellar biosynthesis GTPase FlhF
MASVNKVICQRSCRHLRNIYIRDVDLEKKIIKRDRILAYLAIVAFIAVAVAVTAYSFLTRTLSDFSLAIPTLLAFYAIFALKLVIDKRVEIGALTPSKFNYFGFGYVFVLLGAAFVTFGLFTTVRDGIYYLTKLDSVYLVAISALMVGIGLFFIRLHVRFWYGAVEVAVGVIVAISVYQSNAGKPATSLLLGVLTAGVYLIVRGLDNVHQGWATDKLNKLIGDRLNRQAKKQIELAEQLAADQKRKEEEKAKQLRRDEAVALREKRRKKSEAQAAEKARQQEIEKDRRAKAELERLEKESLVRKLKELEVAIDRNIATRRAPKTEQPATATLRVGSVVDSVQLGRIAREIARSEVSLSSASSARQVYEEAKKREALVNELAAFPQSAQDEVKHYMKFVGGQALNNKEGK